MTFGSLFAGIGGFDLGLERAGMRCAFQVEVDEYARGILARHWPDVPRWSDLRLLDPGWCKPVDLLCGGFPCQPVSKAGRQGGEDDLRWLWPEMFRIVRGLRPRWVLAENVPALRRRGADRVLADLEAAGYACWPLVVGADHLAAPHRRSRCWLLAHAARLGVARPGNGAGGAAAAGTAVAGLLRTDWPAGPRHVDSIPRATDGVSSRLAAMKALGNAVVPQVAELIGRAILAAEGGCG